MRAVVLKGLGGTDQLVYDENVAEPVPGPGQVRVRLQAAALNHRDVWIRRGLYAGIVLPAILGSDGVGIVDQVGDGVDSGLVGTRVWIDPSLSWGPDPRVPDFSKWRILGMPDAGTYAEAIVVDAAQVVECPADWSSETAASLPLAGLTAWRALVTRGGLREGANQRVFVTGIGGGVSQMALQIASAAGAKVYVSSSSDAKIADAVSAGAAGGVNYRNDDWVSKARELIGDDGPDIVIDSAAGKTIDDLVDLVRPGGRIVNYGQTTGPCPNLEVRRLFWKQVDLLGTTMGNPEEFRAMTDFFVSRKLRPDVRHVLPLKEASAAHELMESGEQTGKIVLSIES
jgi:NADPH:quinone reductase-like Zn-dependent oxidoreductase